MPTLNCGINNLDETAIMYGFGLSKDEAERNAERNAEKRARDAVNAILDTPCPNDCNGFRINGSPTYDTTVEPAVDFDHDFLPLVPYHVITRLQVHFMFKFLSPMSEDPKVWLAQARCHWQMKVGCYKTFEEALKDRAQWVTATEEEAESHEGH